MADLKTSRSVVVAVDGTAASGKGTLAKLLARKFGFAHLDSGSLYRLVALAVEEAGGDPENAEHAVQAAHAIDLTRAGEPAIRSDRIGRLASVVSAHPPVRAALLKFQRDFAAHPVGESRGAVIDGRDIGTVICPDAAAKLFVDARPEVRAHRRWLELGDLGIRRDEARLLAELVDRDRADRDRPISPMRPAPDAALLDTSDLSIDAAFAAALALVEPKVEAALKAQPMG
jgi:cytidylate kinase